MHFARIFAPALLMAVGAIAQGPEEPATFEVTVSKYRNCTGVSPGNDYETLSLTAGVCSTVNAQVEAQAIDVIYPVPSGCYIQGFQSLNCEEPNEFNITAGQGCIPELLGSDATIESLLYTCDDE